MVLHCVCAGMNINLDVYHWQFQSCQVTWAGVTHMAEPLCHTRASVSNNCNWPEFYLGNARNCPGLEPPLMSTPACILALKYRVDQLVHTDNHYSCGREVGCNSLLCFVPTQRRMVSIQYGMKAVNLTSWTLTWLCCGLQHRMKTYLAILISLVRLYSQSPA